MITKSEAGQLETLLVAIVRAVREANTPGNEDIGLTEISSQAAFDVLAERERQIKVEGWTAEHDDDHEEGDLAAAGAAYAVNAACNLNPQANPLDEPPTSWPWSPEWWKGSTPRRDLVKAAALIIAEIEKYDRAHT